MSYIKKNKLPQFSLWGISSRNDNMLNSIFNGVINGQMQINECIRAYELLCKNGYVTYSNEVASFFTQALKNPSRNNRSICNNILYHLVIAEEMIKISRGISPDEREFKLVIAPKIIENQALWDILNIERQSKSFMNILRSDIGLVINIKESTDKYDEDFNNDIIIMYKAYDERLKKEFLHTFLINPHFGAIELNIYLGDRQVILDCGQYGNLFLSEAQKIKFKNVILNMIYTIYKKHVPSTSHGDDDGTSRFGGYSMRHNKGKSEYEKKVADSITITNLDKSVLTGEVIRTAKITNTINQLSVEPVHREERSEMAPHLRRGHWRRTINGKMVYVQPCTIHKDKFDGAFNKGYSVVIKDRGRR